MTYLPKKIVKIDPSDVAKLSIFDGNTGFEMKITDEKAINRIITNLNNVNFKKGKSSSDYVGFNFSTTIIDHDGETIEELTINADDTVIYKGFFYTSVEEPSIDYDYIEKLVRK
jgi:hypothetical protein